jgi:hypothetical protein
MSRKSKWEVRLKWRTPLTATVTVEATDEHDAVEQAWRSKGSGYCLYEDDTLDFAEAHELVPLDDK